MVPNKEKKLEFSKRLDSIWLTNACDYYIDKRTIVANIGVDNAVVSTQPEISLAPRTSTILQKVMVRSADSLVLIHIPEKINLGGIILDKDWSQLSLADPSFPSDVPLYKSAQFEVGEVTIDPFVACGLTDTAEATKKRKFLVKVNLWFSPENTNCGIHNHRKNPKMLEVHTQIYGVGRMQKFLDGKDFESIYQDVILGAGMTHKPFASVKEDGAFYYPWHQYFSDTDCIWMAVEYHLQ